MNEPSPLNGSAGPVSPELPSRALQQQEFLKGCSVFTWLLVGISIACAVQLVADDILPGCIVFFGALLSGLGLLGLGLLAFLLWFGLMIGYLLSNRTEAPCHRLLLVPAIALAALSAYTRHVPRRIVFELSRPAMDRWRMAGGGQSPTVSWIGLLPVVQPPDWFKADWPQPGFIVRAGSEVFCEEGLHGFVHFDDPVRAEATAKALRVGDPEPRWATAIAMGDGWYWLETHESCTFP